MTALTFDALGLSPELLQSLKQLSYTEPSPIQAQAVPLLMTGQDLIGQAQTGTGKTAAFAIPIIEKIDVTHRGIQAIIICPTRELALQVAEAFRKLAQFKPNLTVVSIYGGQSIDKQMQALKKRPQILIATPGRLLDFLRRNTFHLKFVNTLVLDEADEMLNMGFRDDIEAIMGHLPETRQTIFFSATMPKAILDLTSKYQRNPLQVTITPEPQETPQITQTYFEVVQKTKPQILATLIAQHELKLALVFCNTKRQVDFLAEHLKLEGLAAEGLHGGKAQNQRERILNRFRKGDTRILVATDVAARGIDVKNVEAVVNYDLPEDGDNYIHRIGRTGRAGQSGKAFSLVASHQIGHLCRLQKSQNYAITRAVLEGTELPNTPAFAAVPTGPAPQRPTHGRAPARKFKPRHKQKANGKRREMALS